MAKKNNGFLKKLLATFKVEAEEHVHVISSGLIELEKGPEAEKQIEIVETIFREAHSLKGAARAVNMTEIEALCQSLESIFAALKSKDLTISSALFDVLHQAVDGLGKSLASAEAERTAAEKAKITALIRQLERALKDALSSPKPVALEEEEVSIVREPEVSPSILSARRPLDEKKPMLAETVRISTAKLDLLLLQAEELLSAKLAAWQRVTELREIKAALTAWKREWAKIHPAFEFLEWTSDYLKTLESKVATLIRSAEHDHRSLEGMIVNLLEDMKQVLLLPFSSLLGVFPKVVRDLSREQGKDVELVIHGAEIEIDRRILEEIKDPLIHLVRNCIDHGIEKPAERERKKKLSRGTVTIAIMQKNGSKIEMLISDDGAGIDVEKVRATALKLGIVSPEESEKMNESEALSLIFQSGVSTSPMITDISGRGLGLAIVREKVEKLDGVVSLETHLDTGTTFRIVLPLTLATFRGVLVRVNDQLFVLPTSNVERVVRVNKDKIKTVENQETIRFNEQAVSLVWLRDILELPQKSSIRSDNFSSPVRSQFVVATEVATTNHEQVIVLGAAEKRIAFLVDEILGELEVLVKSLGKQLSRVRNIAGATVLGNGRVVPILNVPDLMKSAVKVAAAPTRATVTGEEVTAKRKSILIAEDSITARMLLKNILEAAGYYVKTAVDGVEAFTALKVEDFDLVVSDVDMPRMNGFDLTAKIRSDKKLTELPVVLVTALESRKDREHGIDVGANAYIVKSSFDQGNLLEVIRRLI